jgi:hypothetical protein
MRADPGCAIARGGAGCGRQGDAGHLAGGQPMHLLAALDHATCVVAQLNVDLTTNEIPCSQRFWIRSRTSPTS